MARKFKFVGEHDRFTTNHYYTAREIVGKMPTVNPYTLKNNLLGKYEFDESLLTKKTRLSASAYPIFSSEMESISAKWLKRRLI